ncbi:poly-gamma-glutamate hydrolase family protein [Streptomyces sp. NPDC102274]|uniref:poly-gamma-glutamate hydrolase family protein n=1 Tax=Streptomyces sp. NPDC102274 TaxID=3366151 RepID=UPI003813898A
MADTYPSYAALAAAEAEGVDYTRTSLTPAGATWASIAIHGGSIEPGSGEVARAVADGRMAFFEFAGIKNSGNGDLHLTSTVYDEPMGIALVAAARRCLSFHGYTGTTGVAETAIGGLDPALVARVTASLETRGFVVISAPSEISGTNPLNICNKTTTSAGVQLEMSRAQRAAFFPNGDLSRAMRESGQRTAAFWDYAEALRSAYTGLGTVAQTSINVSRYTLIPAPSPDIDLTATVATDRIVTGGSHFVALVGRYQDTSNSYLARLEFTTASAVALTLRRRLAGTETLLGGGTVPGLTHEPNRRFAIRLQITGSALRAKTWLASGREPAAWTVAVTDTSLTTAGQIGTRSILSTANTNALPVLATWGDVSAPIPQRFTLARAVNGIVKPHPSGAPVALADPDVWGL